MTARASEGDRRRPAPGTDSAHGFDQTNGVLGPDAEDDGRERPREVTPPTTFGVPPIVSL